MDQPELLRKAVEAFEAAGAEYLLVGSVASAVYGEPRLTLDIDVVADLTEARTIAEQALKQCAIKIDATVEAVLASLQRTGPLDVPNPDYRGPF